jgi:WD40 repeat protein
VIQGNTNIATSQRRMEHCMEKPGNLPSPVLSPMSTDRVISLFDSLGPSNKADLLLSLIRLDILSFLYLTLYSRSPLPVLQSVSSVVVPYMRRDFIAHLPIEIAFIILSYLDIHSINRASCVSKSWNRIIHHDHSDAHIWKQKLAVEGWLPSVSPKLSYKDCYRDRHLLRNNWIKNQCRRLRFPAHGNRVVTCLQFDDEKIVSGSDDCTIQIFDIHTGALRKKFVGHDGGVWALQYWNNALVSGGTDRTIRVWNIQTGKCTHVFHGHISTVRCLIFMHVTGHDRPYIVTGSRDATLRIWKLPDPDVDEPFLPLDTDSQRPNPYFMHFLSGHSNSVRSVAGEENILVSGSYDTTVRVWDILTGRCLYVFEGHREKVYSVGYSHSLSRAFSGSMDASLRIWCTKTGTCLNVLEGNRLSSVFIISRTYFIGRYLRVIQ